MIGQSQRTIRKEAASKSSFAGSDQEGRQPPVTPIIFGHPDRQSGDGKKEEESLTAGQCSDGI
jgi:hypothetical protein